MGYYINHMPDGKKLSTKGKWEELFNIPNSILIAHSIELKDFEEDLVCIVENKEFDAALYIDSEHTLQTVLKSIEAGDNRVIRWMRVPGAKYLSGYSLNQSDLVYKNDTIDKISEYFNELICTMKK